MTNVKPLACVMLLQAHHLPKEIGAAISLLGKLHASGSSLSLYWIDWGVTPSAKQALEASLVRLGHSSEPLSRAPSLASTLASVQEDWVLCIDPAPAGQAGDLIAAAHQAIHAHRGRDGSLALISLRPEVEPGPWQEGAVGAELLTSIGNWRHWVIRRSAMSVLADIPGDAMWPASWAADGVLWQMLLRVAPASVAQFPAPARAAAPEPPHGFWKDVDNYLGHLENALVLPLERAADECGSPPRWLQAAALQHLHWYFTVDARAQAPTVSLSESRAVEFHHLMGRALGQVHEGLLMTCAPLLAEVAVCHALWSYQGPTAWSAPMLDAYDHEQQLVRLSYYIQGARPAEAVCLNGSESPAQFAKYRAWKFFHRTLFQQRIAWFKADAHSELSLQLNGSQAAVAVGPCGLGVSHSPQFSAQASVAICAAVQAYPPGKGGQLPLPDGWAGWKVRLLKALARMPPFNLLYKDAWIFIDRDWGADDSAEHLYRWVRKRHPEINAWYLLRRESSDWPRLQAEGFRLMPATWRRKLLTLNSREIISSHTDCAFGALDRRVYGDAMRWRSTFLQHGVIKDDLSHWLSPLEFDCFVTSSPAEHDSIVADGTPYPYTDREVRRTGLPRHDRLFRIANQMPSKEVNLLLVMPTWRASLVDRRALGGNLAELQQKFAASAYARHWRSLMSNEHLHRWVIDRGLKLAFMPHANSLPFVDAFELPDSVQIIDPAESVVQNIFARTALFITDYTSVAFTMAFLRRPVFYYQFDQSDFYQGGHNWRPGYFDYERDGFGPVALSEPMLLDSLRRFFVCGGKMEEIYLKRMAQAMPEQDDLACERVYSAIRGVRKPNAH